MDNILNLAEVNWFGFICTIFLLLAAVVYSCELIGKFFKLIGKPIKWKKTRETDHDLILKNSEAIKALAELHKKDADTVTEHEKKLSDDLSSFMMEVRTDIKTFTENRVHDREQSRNIQKELTDSIKEIVSSQKTRDEQISALMCGSKELLGNTIDERYEKYIALGGIPQNEVDEFDSIYEAYRGLNGNHGRQTKYEYVKEHLPVIPVKTELIIK